ncbi:hypothetical protein ElP_28690 [Tautonia plasticadhaerens]|uniref:Uncharacterized protein n=1 Tax=Tautonia plasticadhaerens TaxID=2527974 RepID=A0A518H295_9BACT|nr:hypothetical protein ElP_28690 [Tautonia plasticadhaerens]
MASQNESSPSQEEDRFLIYLQWAREEVRSWPEWKQNLLGWHYSKKRAREAGEREQSDKSDYGPGRKA